MTSSPSGYSTSPCHEFYFVLSFVVSKRQKRIQLRRPICWGWIKKAEAIKRSFLRVTDGYLAPCGEYHQKNKKKLRGEWGKRCYTTHVSNCPVGLGVASLNEW